MRKPVCACGMSILWDFLSDPGVIVGFSLVILATCFYAITRPRPERCGVDLDSQSVELPVRTSQSLVLDS